MKFVLLSLLTVCSAFAHAETKDEKVLRLFEIQGVVASYQTAIDEGRAQAQMETQQMLDQMMSESPRFPWRLVGLSQAGMAA